jgi:muramoyltetrapeptide carboxypeptidase
VSVKPHALEPGARLAVVAPASAFNRDEFDRGIEEIRRLGFEPVYDDSVFDRQRYLAGSPEVRAAAIHSAWRDPTIAGLIGVRGGYGSAQVLPLLGLGRGTVGYDRSSFMAAVCRREPMGELLSPALETLRPGEASGMLLGGTLTQLLASLATPFAFAPPPGHVLFLDEIGERPYRLDRMVTQLRQAGLLARAAAVVIGELPQCDEPSGDPTARAVMGDLFADFPGPVVIGFPSGHTAGPSTTLPFGVACRVIAGGRPRLIIEEAAVE